jgi:hypothetical protein
MPFILRNTWTASRPSYSEIPATLPISIQRLTSLLDENGEDDFGRIGPTQHAFKNALLLIARATTKIEEDIPSSSVVDSQGGIRVTWRRGGKTVKLVCPATKDASVYLYHSSPAGSSIRNQNVTPAALAEMLTWLCERARAASR